jgi:nitrate/nitrite transport system permease protein
MSTTGTSDRTPGWSTPRLDHFIRVTLRNVGVPLLAIAVFLGLWSATSKRIKVSIGELPGPTAVVTEVGNLWHDHLSERQREKDFYVRQEDRKKAYLEKNPGGEWKDRKYAGRPTFLAQIITSLETVFAGFLIASLVAVPVGVLCGLSPAFNRAINPFVQIFKPVSPLAWLPIVMLMVDALYVSDDPLVAKSFVSSAIVVALCSLWPTLINTALGVASIDQDYLNVARVLRLSWFARIWKIVLPAALPLIFTGLRLSLGVGWMVLIAAEMLAQNPGLGKFVWDMFQNGSSHTLAQIMVAVFAIGAIGFLLDRIMMTLQKAVSFGAAVR